MVGDDTLVFPFAGELHIAKLQGGCILGHLRLASCASLHPQVGLVVDLCVVQDLVVFLPGKGHGRITGAGRRADECHIGALECRLGLRLDSDLRFWKVIWETNNRDNFRLK